MADNDPRLDEEISERGMCREDFDSNFQERTNERATTSAAVTDLRDEVNAQLAGHLDQIMSAIRTGPSNGVVGRLRGRPPRRFPPTGSQ